jgi:glycine oxidase
VAAFDRGEAGRGASWAAAGMLAACAEVEPGEERLFALNRESQRMWPAFAAELEGATGVDLGYRDEGTLIAALTRDELEQLRFTCELQRRFGLAPVWLSAAETRAREPHLRPGVAGGLLCPEDHQVDNRCLAAALRAAFVAAGGELHEGVEVAAVDASGGRVTGLRIGDERQAADVVVVAAGPWSRTIPGLPDEARPPVRPIKGQMLALQMDRAAPLVSHVLWAPKIYLVPRNDGRLIVGATVEERGFDAQLTAGGVLALLEAAWRAVPAIEELPIVEMWAGFRPGSRDDAPLLGPGPVDGLVYATGHHRNGILLAPLTADAVSAYILTGEMPAVARPFGFARFAREAVPA